jgi:hypothetical protein
MGVEHMFFNGLVKERVSLLTDDAGSTSLPREVVP